MGTPLLKFRKNPRTGDIQLATEMNELINDIIYDFRSQILSTGDKEGLLGQIGSAKKNRLEANVCYGLLELIYMCLEDDDVMQYVYECPAPTAQHAKYTDWFFPYVRDVLKTIENLPPTAYVNKKK